MSRRTHQKRQRKLREASELKQEVSEGRELAQKLGLDPYHVQYWIVDYEEMIQAAAYDGFQNRWPHWKWGRQYVQLKLQNTYTPMHIYELVINDDPSQAYLQESNTVEDQKAVITHVEAHADFFKNNSYFKEMASGMDATQMINQHADRIQSIIQDSDVTRSEVEEWIDNILCIQENIDQDSALHRTESPIDSDAELTRQQMEERLSDAGFSKDMRDEIITDEMLGEKEETNGDAETDLLYYLYQNGMQYDETEEKAVELEQWQREIISILRKESFYFSPQRMTKTMNEGWAAFWESRMMSHLNFVDADGLVNYADHFAKVVSADGMNPYAVGLNLWEYVENKYNREEVVSKLLQVETVDPQVFFDRIDLKSVREKLEPNSAYYNISNEHLDSLIESVGEEKLDMDAIEAAKNGEFDASEKTWKVLNYDGLAEFLYSLTLSHNKSFLLNIKKDEVRQIWRRLSESERNKFNSVPEALENVNYTFGWEKMREERDIHNDSTFIKKYLSQEFVDQSGYFTYEKDQQNNVNRVTSTDARDVREKMLLEVTNFGKPTIVVEDGNYKNRNELLLRHEFNGINIDIPQAKDTLKRVFKLYGRPVNLKTVYRKQTRDGSTLQPLLLRFDGTKFSEKDVSDEAVEDLLQDSYSYNTHPDGGWS